MIESGARYVAMGSSFAAGPGLRPRAPGSPRQAGRSAVNYAHLIAQRLDLALTDVTYSGATTGDVLKARADDRPAQIDAVTAGTALVTITCGGNDVGYVPRLLLASLPRPLRAVPSVRRRADSYADPRQTDEWFGALRENLAAIAAEVRRRSPGCRLVFVDYLTLVPADPAIPTGSLPAGVAAWGRRVSGRLAEVTQAAAGDAGCDYAPASAASAGHHAWSPVPWTRRFHLSLRGGAPYHPNAAGMDAVAKLVLGIVGQAGLSVFRGIWKIG
jgi:lysophospholipase L1-like esterase